MDLPLARGQAEPVRPVSEQETTSLLLTSAWLRSSVNIALLNNYILYIITSLLVHLSVSRYSISVQHWPLFLSTIQCGETFLCTFVSGFDVTSQSPIQPLPCAILWVLPVAEDFKPTTAQLF